VTPAANQIGYALAFPVERVLGLPAAPEHRAYPLALALAAQTRNVAGDFAASDAVIGGALAAGNPNSEAYWRVEHEIAVSREGTAIAEGDHAEAAAHAELAARLGHPQVLLGTPPSSSAWLRWLKSRRRCCPTVRPGARTCVPECVGRARSR
jgi:hypothetical protein